MSFNAALLATATLAHLGALYNQHNPTGKTIKGFKDKTTALSRVQSMAVQAGLQAVEVDGKVALVTRAPAPQPAVAKSGKPANAIADDIAAAKPAAKAKAAKVTGAQRGPKPNYAETDVITVVAKANPKREGTASYKRFALYKNGMTVKQFLDAAAKLQPEFTRGRWRGDLEWDRKFGFITVAPATKSTAKAA